MLDPAGLLRRFADFGKIAEAATAFGVSPERAGTAIEALAPALAAALGTFGGTSGGGASGG